MERLGRVSKFTVSLSNLEEVLYWIQTSLLISGASTFVRHDGERQTLFFRWNWENGNSIAFIFSLKAGMCFEQGGWRIPQRPLELSLCRNYWRIQSRDIWRIQRTRNFPFLVISQSSRFLLRISIGCQGIQPKGIRSSKQFCRKQSNYFRRRNRRSNSYEDWWGFIKLLIGYSDW